jgi:MoxR-like ATPase
MSVNLHAVEPSAADEPVDRPLPYPSSREHVVAELARIEQIVQAAAAAAAKEGATTSAGEVAPRSPALARLEQRRRAVTLASGTQLRLVRLQRRFGLTPFDLDVLLLGLLPELYGKYLRLFRAIGGERGRGLTFDVAMLLLCPTYQERLEALRRFGDDAPLLRYGLLRLSEETDEPRSCRGYRVDDRIAAYLLSDADDLDPQLASYAELAALPHDFDDLLLPEELVGRLSDWLALHAIGGVPRGRLIHIAGAAGGGKTAVAGALARALGLGLLVVRGEAIWSLAEPARTAALWLALREARLLDAAICWEGFGALHGQPRGVRDELLRAIEAEGRLTFLCAEAPWEGIDAAGRDILHLQLPRTDAAAQAELWRRALGSAETAGAIDIDLLVSRHRLIGGRIQAAVAAARDHAFARSPGAPEVGTADLLDACRRQSQPKLGALARRVVTSTTWSDLVLSRDRLEVLRRVCDHARHRNRVLDDWGFDAKLPTGKGLAALFSGPPGTGKTMAASVVAHELGLELYQIDLSAVVSKYIGETEKLLEQIFREAESSRAILFFDEADALFGKRTEVADAHDRYANLETSYLLQRMDSYEGVVILASNWSRNMDEAFVRRLRFVVEFDLPDERERLQLWERSWPARLPRDPSVDLAVLARRFELAGGYIRNILLSAAFQAAADGASVTQQHLLRAARAEFRKMGKVMDEGAFR